MKLCSSCHLYMTQVLNRISSKAGKETDASSHKSDKSDRPCLGVCTESTSLSEKIRDTGGSKDGWLHFAGFCAIFVVLLLAVVILRGGSSLYGRVQRWDALRVSIQSTDPARVALDNPKLDTALIQDFLLLSPDNRNQARAFYDKWRAEKDWNISMEGTKISQSTEDALVTRFLKLTRNRRVRLYWEREEWLKKLGVWYVKEVKEEFQKEEDVPRKTLIFPVDTFD